MREILPTNQLSGYPRDGSRAESGGLVNMSLTHDNGTLDPRDVFLDTTDVMRRYGWAKTKGYQNLKDRELVSAPVMIHPDRWRLDELQVWEERRMEIAEAALAALVAPGREPKTITDLVPSPKGAGGRRNNPSATWQAF